ncbi:MAG: hypothetical protein K6G47_13575 [Clostridia bacterium]|nr:hypothetical protein [Clostridia bacterium]
MANKFRIKCPSCGKVIDIESNTTCSCGSPLVLPEDGMIEMYRVGNPFGAAVGFGIYLNEIPMGHLANTGLVRIPVPYGHYKVHMTQGMSRRCKDQEFDVTPQNRIVYLKAHVNLGLFTNTVVIEQSTADQMPAK